ncbi:hypothetical protein L9F63_016670 [Diploptera punctata]|uniref:Uncharacterized protein n=1 Tax=Diploptera punctata TaxID=6984 RepID=A0AAD8A160_DIPPU|nr:hypothetical protein L9F63_016670 [Diploptera punctata]
MESVLDLWRLLEESSMDTQDCGHSMTPSGDAPEPVGSSLFYHQPCGSDKLTSPEKWRRITPRIKDNWMEGVKFDKCKEPNVEFDIPEDTWKENDITAANLSFEKPEENDIECCVVTENVPTALTLNSLSEENISQEQKRREVLFQIERLLLRARPYDSIGFFYVQREIYHYLELDEFQNSARLTSLH